VPELFNYKKKPKRNDFINKNIAFVGKKVGDLQSDKKIKSC
jgi:hypothetical protein